MSSSKPYWKRGKESAKGGGGGKSEDLEDRRFQLSKEPYFNNVTPVDMENYLDRCHLYALTNHPQIAPWIKGKIPHVMLEFPQAREKKNLLGLLAKYHIPKDGSIQETNLTANEVRLNLIADTITEDELEANEGHSEDEEWEYIEVLEKDAIKSLFPTVDSKARVATRSHLEREAQSLMGKNVIRMALQRYTDENDKSCATYEGIRYCGSHCICRRTKSIQCCRFRKSRGKQRRRRASID